MLQSGKVALERREDLLQRAEPRICAFDIETTKLPLQFPNSEHDQVSVALAPLNRADLHQHCMMLLGSYAHGGCTRPSIAQLSHILTVGHQVLHNFGL